MALGDSESAFHFVERDGGRGFDFLGGHSSLAQLARERHREAAGMRRRDQLLRGRSDAVLEARRKRILRAREHSALRGNGALAVAETSAPYRRCVSLHKPSSITIIEYPCRSTGSPCGSACAWRRCRLQSLWESGCGWRGDWRTA